MTPSSLGQRAREWLHAADASTRDSLLSLTSLLESVRREAMEEAAKVAQDHEPKYPRHWLDDDQMSSLRERVAICEIIAAAIRTLAAPPPSSENREG